MAQFPFSPLFRFDQLSRSDHHLNTPLDTSISPPLSPSASPFLSKRARARKTWALTEQKLPLTVLRLQ